MSEQRFKIVFKGEIGFDYDEAEVRENLQKNCGFEAKTVERLFAGGSFILKKDLDEATAVRYRETLQRLGALCDVVPMTPAASVPLPLPPSAVPAVVRQQEREEPFRCPACGHGQEKGVSCLSCGVVFSKLERLREKQTREVEAGAGDAPRPPLGSRPVAPLRSMESTFPLREVLLAGIGTIVGMALLQSLLGRGLMLVGLILLPLIFFCFVLVKALFEGKSFLELLEDYVGMELGAEDAADTRGIPVTTLVLTGLSLLATYGATALLGNEAVISLFAFLPAESLGWNLPLSLLTALFFHANSWQLWGSLIFLWVFGEGLEQRLGPVRLLVIFLLSGTVAWLAGALAHKLLLGSPLHGFGASGAIAGLAGLALAVQGRERLEFSLPFLGAVSWFSPLRLLMLVQPVLLVGLFFFLNLSSVHETQREVASALVGHTLHLAGLLAGLALAPLIVPPPAGERR